MLDGHAQLVLGLFRDPAAGQLARCPHRARAGVKDEANVDLLIRHAHEDLAQIASHIVHPRSCA
jgi:hypothetical protein